ncbi:MAG TPA: hypothetical protein VK435_08290 [Thermodesulfovibrionales bacterium]|nr:hypothetical protein [Thermodesulfovibrionales bacterium]
MALNVKVEDIQKVIKNGIDIVQKGIGMAKDLKGEIEPVIKGFKAAQKRAAELTEEGKKGLRIFEIKTKVQKEFGELGARVYGLGAKGKNPLLDNKVKMITARIKKFESQISALEGKKKVVSKKTVAKKKTGKPASPRKSAS